MGEWMVGRVWLQNIRAPPAPPRTPGRCVFYTETLSATETLNYKEFAPSQNWANDWGPENDLLKCGLRIEISG